MKLLNKINFLVVKDFKLKDKLKYFMVDFREDRIFMFFNYDSKEKFFEDVDCVYIVQKIFFRIFFGDL